jgi:hypothetical protein
MKQTTGHKREAPPPAATATRDRVIKMHDEQGMSFRQIGMALGFSGQRAHALYHSAMKMAQRD